MKPSPITARLFSLQVAGRKEDTEELAFLEEYMAWVAARGPKDYEELRTKERYKQSITNYRLRVQQAKRVL